MKKTAITYGLLAGIILVAMFYLTMPPGREIDFERGEIIGYTTMIIALSMIFWAIRSYRNRNLGGSITFGTGFRVGILVTLVASMLYVAGWLFYFNFVDDSFVEQYTEYYIEKLEQSDKSPQEIETQKTEFLKSMELYQDNIFIMILYTFIEIFPLGLIITIIAALILRRRQPPAIAS